MITGWGGGGVRSLTLDVSPPRTANNHNSLVYARHVCVHVFVVYVAWLVSQVDGCTRICMDAVVSHS